MRSVRFAMLATLAVSAVACSNGGPSIWDKLIDDPNTDRNALYDRNAKVCGATIADARPGCTYHYDGQKLHITEDPQRDAPFSSWVTITETEYRTECDYYDDDYYYDDYSASGTYCYDVPYTVTYLLSPSGIKYNSGGRAVNARVSGKTNGFIASNKNANQMIRKTAERYHAVYGMGRGTAIRVAGQVLTVRANKGILDETDALAQTLSSAFPKTITSAEAEAALKDAREKRDLTAAKGLLERVAGADLASMTPEQRQAFLSQELGLGL